MSSPVAAIPARSTVLPAAAALDPPSARRLAGHTLRSGFTLSGGVLRLGAAAALDRLRPRSGAPRTAAAATAAALAGGPTVIKLAQLLATRADLVPDRLRRGLGTLHDHAPAPPPEQVLATLRRRLGAPPESVFARFDPVPLAAGSVATVHRAVLLDGTAVAVKLRRDGVRTRMAADLALLRGGAHVLAALPAVRGLPVVAATAQLADAIGAQLDLDREAAALTAIADATTDLPGVEVPRPRPIGAGSVPGLLVMDLMDGLDDLDPGPSGPLAVERALEAHYRLVFRHGLVHCDLHPGNLYLRRDGSVVLLDAGFVVELSASARRAFTEFFLRMGTGNAVRCAEIVLSTAQPAPGADPEAFRADLIALVRGATGARVREFSLMRFAAGLFDLQRRHQLRADPEFVFPLLSLLVFEGTIRRVHPDLDFQSLALPHLFEALHRNWSADRRDALVAAGSGP